MIKVAPSILAADQINLERDVRRAAEAGCDWLHVDVMDAHFVPNLAFSPDVVRHLKKAVDVPLDVHLMMDHPETLMDVFLDAGADVLTIHAEIEADVPALLAKIRKRGVMAGAIAAYQDEADLILTMTVEPGFGGQKLDESVYSKISELRESGYTGYIEADGGVTEENLPILISKGLNAAVMGTALFRAENMRASIDRIHEMAK